MPVVFIEGLPGLRTDAKKKMIEKITAAVDEAYHVGETPIFVREYPAHDPTEGKSPCAAGTPCRR